MAQAQDLPQDLTSVSPAQALSLSTGRLYRFSSWPNNPPLPPGVLLTDPAIGEDGFGLATNVFYSASLAAVFWDDRESLAEQMLLEAAASGNHQMFQQEQQGEELGAQGPYGTDDFYLEPVSVVSNLFNAMLHNTTNGSTYIINSTEAIDPVTNSVWLVEGSLQGGTNDVTPFALGIALRTNNLFIAAQACDECATNTLPLWWQLAYFGVTGVDPNGDYDCDGVTNLLEFLNSTDPNKIVFSLSVTNEYVATTVVPVQVNIANGAPSYLAILLNDDSPTNASWQPFTSTSLSVELPTNGTYVITVGLCGLATNATQSWQSLTVFRDTTPLVLALTNLATFSGSRPFIDPAGYASRSLSALNWTLVDAAGATNTGSGTVVAQDWSLSDQWHTTNWLQCVDLPLALGTNWVCIQATDWAGSVAETNFSYVFDTNGDTNAPALSLVWPPAGALVSGESFTVQASTDDDTAAVALQYFDGDGILQTVNGRVERGGTVWVPDVPLAAGTSSLSLLTTDAAGNVSTNNLTVVRSSMQFTINPLSQDQMKYGYATVAGTAEDPDCTVTVNGVEGTNHGNGSWHVDNVPLPPGGTVTLQATAHLAGGTNVQALLTQERGPIVFTQTYDYQLDYSFTPSTNSTEGRHTVFHWARGIGGTNVHTSWSVDSQGTVVWSNASIIVWPPDNGYWPSLTGQAVTTSYSYGQLTGTSANPANIVPDVEWMEKSSSAGNRPGSDNLSWTHSSGRQVRLFTGGSAVRRSQGLFDLSASLTCESVLYSPVEGWSERYPQEEFEPFLLPASPPVTVPPEQITLGALGKLGSDGHLWTTQPDGQELLATEMAPVISYEGPLPDAPKYKLVILCNGVPATNTPNTTIVGQKIALTCDVGGLTIASNTWTIPGDTVKRYEFYMPQYDTNTYSILEYLQPADYHSNSISYYWINGASSLPVQCTATVSNQTLKATAYFTVNRPVGTLTATTTTNSPPVDILYSADGSIDLQYGIRLRPPTPGEEGIYLSFSVSTPTNGAGSFGYVQRVDSTLRRWRLDDGTQWKKQGTNIIDTDPVGTIVNSTTYVDNSDEDATYFPDSPGFHLYSPGGFSSKWVSISDSFTGWLVYKPVGDSIWVTLRKLQWSWSGGASKDTNGSWTLSSGYSPPPVNPASQPSIELPTWNGATILLRPVPDN